MRNLLDMMGLDVYLSSLNKEELQHTQKYIHPRKQARLPLICGDMYLNHYHGILSGIKKEADAEALRSLAFEYKLNFDVNIVYKKHYDALIITNVNQDILWVSEGFTSMTGYSRGYAIGEKPNFLQGPNTSEETKRRIRQQLQAKESFQEIIINYRKDQSEYTCEIELFPISGRHGETRAFLAMERKI